MARVAAKYPTRANEFAAASASASAAVWKAVSDDGDVIAMAGDDAAKIRAAVASLLDSPLWPDGMPGWVASNLARMEKALPAELGAGLWFDWYRERLSGRGRPEDYEIIFATVPVEVWDRGFAAANAWIAERLPKTEMTDDATGEPSSQIIPPIPKPGVGPRVTERDNRVDLDVNRSPQHPASKRTNALLDELRDAARDLCSALGPTLNTHRQIYKVAGKYLAQLELDDPDVNVTFALGLRLENARAAARRRIADRFDGEPEFTDSQHEAVASVLRIHAVFVATDPEGAELLTAAERYDYRREDDDSFRRAGEPVVADVAKSNELATERLVELLQAVLEQMGQLESRERNGVIGRNSLQATVIKFAQLAVGGVVAATAGQIFVQSGYGHLVIQAGAPLSDKAIAFFLNNAGHLRLLAAAAPEGFGFINDVIDWLKRKVGWS